MKQEFVTGRSVVRKQLGNRLTNPLVRLLARTSVTPDSLTWFGFLVVVGAAALIASGHLFAAGWVMLAGSLFDLLDGALARAAGRTTTFGAVLDSTLDRASEGAILIALLVVYSRQQAVPWVILTGIALLSSFLVSYVRARAESAGLECKVGLMTRAERIIILALGLMLSRIPFALVAALGVIAATSLFTAGQRLVHVWSKTRS